MVSVLVNDRDLAIRAALLRWYRLHARGLPWRKTKDPYAVWVSEIMLQQTQVASVIPYYERFLAAFPDCGSLAAARFGKVAEFWSGLGYYRRARLLHRGAKKIVEEFDGRFPEGYDDARSIPGVGHYTASAVLSIAYGQPLPVLDGNVARVAARLEALRGNVAQAKFRGAVERRLNGLISTRKPGNFNQSLMELGQTVCLPRAPRCHACPVKTHCRARQTGHPEHFPAPKPRRASESRYLAAAVIRKNPRVGLVRGLDEGLLEDLWNFPAAFGSSPDDARESLHKKLAPMFGSPVTWHSLAGTVRHRITFRLIEVQLYEPRFQSAPIAASLRWFRISEIQRAATSQLAKKIASCLENTRPTS